MELMRLRRTMNLRDQSYRTTSLIHWDTLVSFKFYISILSMPSTLAFISFHAFTYYCSCLHGITLFLQVLVAWYLHIHHIESHAHANTHIHVHCVRLYFSSLLAWVLAHECTHIHSDNVDLQESITNKPIHILTKTP